jgi:hypothetical protein
MKTQYARKIVQDNSLDITIKGRTNGIIKVLSNNEQDLSTFNELLNGMGYELAFNIFPNPHYFITGKVAE